MKRNEKNVNATWNKRPYFFTLQLMIPTKRGLLTNDSYSQWKWAIGWKLLKQLPRPMCVGPARLPTGAAGKMSLSLFCSWRCRNWCECNESWDAGGNSEIVLSSWKPITCSSAAFPDSRFEDKFLPPVIMWGLVNAEHILEIKGKTKKNNLTLLPKIVGKFLL